MNNRFGNPALQNTNPEEEPHNETACHSFLGLNTPRVTHEEQHDIAGQRTKHARSPGINGQIFPDGRPARTQHDAVAPWEVLSRSHRTRSMGRHVTDLESDMQTESNISGNKHVLRRRAQHPAGTMRRGISTSTVEILNRDQQIPSTQRPPMLQALRPVGKACEIFSRTLASKDLRAWLLERHFMISQRLQSS